MTNTIIKKLIIAVVSTLSVCILISIIGYTPISKQEPNVSYMTFSGLLYLYLIFIAPVIFTAGILFSIVVEKKVKSTANAILTYILGGGVIGIIYYLLILTAQAEFNIMYKGFLMFIIMGVLSSLMFFGVQFSLKPLFSKLRIN